jgi:hypothetical protein
MMEKTLHPTVTYISISGQIPFVQIGLKAALHSESSTSARPVMKRMLLCKILRTTSISSSFRGP